MPRKSYEKQPPRLSPRRRAEIKRQEALAEMDRQRGTGELVVRHADELTAEQRARYGLDQEGDDG